MDVEIMYNEDACGKPSDVQVFHGMPLQLEVPLES